MKQYKLTAWPELPSRFQNTPMRRVVSELSQRYATARELARHSGAARREVEELLERLDKNGLLACRDLPAGPGAGPDWREWGPVNRLRDMMRLLRREIAP